MLSRPLLSLLVALSVPGVLVAQAARDYVYVVGSSTVFPFATVVAERFGRASSFRTPTVEATGSGGGFKLFCDGLGIDYPDITNASRRIKASEMRNCERNGVSDIIEVKVGYDGIVIAGARNAPVFDLTRRELFLALAKQVPEPDGDSFIDNPYRLWSEINPQLPAQRIQVFGPPPTSGTRDELVEQAMQAGCRSFDNLQRLALESPEDHRRICQTVREDGAYIDAGENDNLIVQRLLSNQGAYGIFGYSYLDQNLDRLRALSIDGVEPDYDAIADGSYPITRPLYFYIKKAHIGVIPGLREFVDELTSERAWSDEGYLADRGLVAMSSDERASIREVVRSLSTIPLASRRE